MEIVIVSIYDINDEKAIFFLKNIKKNQYIIKISQLTKTDTSNIFKI